jgi:hypothetical protein
MADTILTRAAAQQLHRASGPLLWFVFQGGPEHRRGYVARPHTMDNQGGVFLPQVLVADSLEELPEIMPAGLTVYPPGPFKPPGVLESWGD